MESYDLLKKAERGAWLSLFAYIILSTLKLLIGSIGSSEALKADGLNNATDVVASIAVIIGLKISRKPPDLNHPYGHFRAETVASMIASFVMITVGIQVLFNAGRKIFEHQIEKPDLFTGIIALISALAMYGVYLFNLQLSKKTNSHSLYAAAQDNRSDALVSIGAFIGIVGAQIGIPWLDPVAALIVGFIICKTAYEIFSDASHTLTDGFNIEKLSRYKETINSVKYVKQIRELKARSHGTQILLDATILVDRNLTVAISHNITDEIERKLKELHNIEHAHIHIEPF
jgi:cation diffusion facilitator family transporter